MVSGWPVSNAAQSITVAADTCTQAGILSTLAMLKGDGAEDFLSNQAEQKRPTSDKNIILREFFKHRFIINKNETSIKDGVLKTKKSETVRISHGW